MLDEVTVDEELFSIIGFKGSGLPTANDFGIKKHKILVKTACQRGYIMHYILVNDQLYLDKMDVLTDNPLNIGGVEPEEGGFLSYIYKNLNLKTEFTGKLLLAKDFIQSKYSGMGFQDIIMFKTILEIQFEKGKEISKSDLSKKIEDFKKKLFSEDNQPQTDSHEDTGEWIVKTYSDIEEWIKKNLDDYKNPQDLTIF